jgi:GT2 family glycosyltransferase
MMKRPPVVDVVILTWNDGALLEVAVDSVVQSGDVAPNPIVVDNGSSPPASVEVPVLLVRNEANRGVAPARNQGVAMGTSPLVCLLDSDARLEPEALTELAAAVLADDGIALAAPVFAGQPAAASAGPAPTLVRKAMRAINLRDTYDSAGTFVDGVRDVDFAIGACQMFRRSAFDEVGGLDESYFYGPEDVDFCLRLRERGWRVVQVASARVEHPARRRFKGLLTRRGIQHAWAVARHLWRHRRFRRRR